MDGSDRPYLKSGGPCQQRADLERTLSSHDTLPAVEHKQDIPTVLGWMYLTEGSKLGAAILLKMAGSIGLSENLGARHLARAPEGGPKNGGN